MANPHVLKKPTDKHVRTWIEISRRAVENNYRVFRGLIGPNVKLWSVVKSNAYGHGLTTFSRVADNAGVDGFCVDSLVEGVRLQKEGIRKPILVTGHTLPELYPEAASCDITLAVSTFEGLKALSAAAKKPDVHFKIDTGMHRHGFYPEDISRAAKVISKDPRIRACVKGVFTHFSSAKDTNYPTYTLKQYARFVEAVKMLEGAGARDLTKHASATGGTLLSEKFHLDAVRIGIGLYGVFPSKEFEMQLSHLPLIPVLSWRAVVAEVKKVKKGDFIGYDLTERMKTDGKIAVLPIGYWHGLPLALSGKGEVLIRGARHKILGRVSMDIATVDATRGACAPGDIVTLIGEDGREELLASDVSRAAGTMPYELLTRLNPLIERVVVK